MPAKSQHIHQGLFALTVNCELYKSVVDFTIQVKTNKSVNYGRGFFLRLSCVFTALYSIFCMDVCRSAKS